MHCIRLTPTKIIYFICMELVANGIDQSVFPPLHIYFVIPVYISILVFVTIAMVTVSSYKIIMSV